MKLNEVIVNEKYSLIGFVMSGTSREFGEIGNSTITKAIGISELLKIQFKNTQISCKNGGITEIGSFKISSLPMKMFANNEFKDINNVMTLHRRILVNGKLQGFDVTIGDNPNVFKLTSKVIIQMAGWFKCGNFTVRHNITSNVAYIAGIPGHSIEKLDAYEIGKETKTGKATKVRTATKNDEVDTYEIRNDFDVITLFDIVRDLNGIIVNLPTEKYERTVAADKKVSSEFVSLGVGEIAEPYIQYPETKLNVNSTFKKVGQVVVNINGMQTPIYTYVPTTRNLFHNGENHIKRFAVGVSDAYVEELKRQFAGSLAMQEITDPVTLTPIRALRGDTAKQLRLFGIDASKLDIISKSKASKFLLTCQQIMENVKQFEVLRINNKYINSIIKETKEAMTNSGVELPIPKYGMFSMYSKEALQIVMDAGIDVFTGAFIKKEDSNEKAIADAEKARAKMEGTYDAEAEADLEITYAVKKYTGNKISVKDLRNRVSSPLITDELLKVMDYMESVTSLKERYEKAVDYKKKVDARILQIKKALWMHKEACYSLGNGKFLGNESEWVETKTRAVGCTAFACTVAGCEDLQVKLSGTTFSFK